MEKCVGFTMMELFSGNREFYQGKFNLPIYSSKLEPNALTKSGLPHIPEANLYVRVGFNNDVKTN